MSATAGYYESHPIITKLAFRMAARRASLSAADKASLDTILSTDANVTVAGQTLDDSAASVGAETSAVSGTGILATLIQFLIANLPEIIALITSLLAAPAPAS